MITRKTQESNMTISGSLAGQPETVQAEDQSKTALAELAKEYCQDLSDAEFETILTLEGKTDDAFTSLAVLVAHHGGDLQPRQIDKIIAAIGKDEVGTYKYQSSIARSLGGKHGAKLSPEQANTFMQCIVRRVHIGESALADLISRYNWGWSEHVDQLLKDTAEDSPARIALLERCGAGFRPEQIDYILKDAAAAKTEKTKALDRQIRYVSGPIDGYSVARNHDYTRLLHDKERTFLLDRRCHKIYALLEGLTKNCAASLSSQQIEQIASLGNARLQARLIAYCGDLLEPEQRQSIVAAAGPAYILKTLMPEDLPASSWKEELIRQAIGSIDASEHRSVDRIVNGYFAAHFQAEHIDELIQQPDSAKILTKVIECQPTKLLREHINAILDIQPELIGITQIEQLGNAFELEHVVKMLANCSPWTVFAFSELYPERLPSAEDAEARMDLVLERCVAVLSPMWIERHKHSFSGEQVGKILAGQPMAEVIASLVEHCPEKFTAEQINAALHLQFNGDRQRELRSKLVKTFWRHCLDHFDGLSGSLRLELARQRPNELSEEQVNILIDNANPSSIRQVITYCGSRFSPEQINQCRNLFSYRKLSSSYTVMTTEELRKPAMKLLLRQGAHRMHPAQISRFIEDDEDGEYSSELLVRYPELLSEEQRLRIIHRFGYNR